MSYAQPRFSRSARPAPGALIAIVALHGAALIAVANARHALPTVDRSVTRIFNLPLPVEPPPPPEATPKAAPMPSAQPAVTVPRVVPLPALPTLPTLDGAAAGDLLGPLVADIGPPALPDVTPPPAVVRAGPRLATSADALRPAYPAAKLRAGEEASLRLRLTIAADGRVMAVEPVGAADPAFLAAARAHILRRWRYSPATEDGRPVAAQLTIRLDFRLDDL